MIILTVYPYSKLPVNDPGPSHHILQKTPLRQDPGSGTATSGAEHEQANFGSPRGAAGLTHQQQFKNHSVSLSSICSPENLTN